MKMQVGLSLLATVVCLSASGIDEAAFRRKMDVSFAGCGLADGETLNAFPALVVLDPAVQDGFDYADFGSPAGGDLRFADADGNELNYEIDTWNTSGRSLVWVQVPALTTETVMTAYWGGVDKVPPAYTTDGSTWSNGYVGVWHLGGTDPLKESTSRRQTLTKSASGVTLSQTGKFGDAAQISGAGSVWLSAGNHADLNNLSALTLEIWALRGDADTDNSPRALFGKRVSGMDNTAFTLFQYTNHTLQFDIDNVRKQYAGTLQSNQWGHVTATFDGTAKQQSCYINGALVTTETTTKTTIPNRSANLLLGNLNAGQSTSWKGNLDEARVSNVARSAAWIAANYRTMNSPTTFAQYGVVEPLNEDVPGVEVAGADVAVSGVTLYGRVVSSGGADTVTVSAYFGFDDAGMQAAGWTSSLVTQNVAPGEFSIFIPMAQLNYYRTYFFRFAVDNAIHATWSYEAGEFGTLGAPALGTPSYVAYPDSLKLSVPLLSAGAAATTVTCFYGLSPALENSVVVETTAVAKTITHILNGDAGATLYYAFKAQNTMPDNPANQPAVWTATNSATIGVREVVWDGVAVPASWDTTSANWYLADAPASKLAFRSGDSVLFSKNAAFNAALAVNAEVFDVTLQSAAAWTLSGNTTLTLNNEMRVNDVTSGAINNVKLSGPGSVILRKGTFGLGNTANDFSGGLFIRGGQLNATVSGNADSLGDGDLHLGADTVLPTANATLSITGADTAAITRNALRLDGGLNAGKLLLTNADLTLNSLTQRGGSLQVPATLGASERLFLGNANDFLTDSVLPPWFIASTGAFLTYGANGVTTLATGNYPASIYYSASGTKSLATDTTAAAAHITAGILNFGGNTFTLGGAILGNSVTLQNGTLRLPDSGGYVFVPANANAILNAPVTGTLYKFGSGMLTLNDLSGAGDKIVQEGTLSLAPPADVTLGGRLLASGSVRVTTATTRITQGAHINGIQLITGGLTLDDCTLDNTGAAVLGPLSGGSGAILTVTNGAKWRQPDTVFNLGNGGHFYAVIINNGSEVRVKGTQIASNGNAGGDDNTILISGENTLWDNGDATFHIASTGGATSATRNRVTITDSAVVTNIAALNIGYKNTANGAPCNDNSMTVSNNASLYSSGTATVGYSYGPNHNACYNKFIITTGARWNAHEGACVINHSGQGVAYDNGLIIDAGAVAQNIGDMHVGRAGAANTWNGYLIVTNSGSLFTRGGVSIGLAYLNSVNKVYRFAHTNSVHVVGGSLGNSLWDVNGQALVIGNSPAAQAGATANANWLRVSAGGTVQNAGTITIGNRAGYTSDNVLILNGGAINAENLVVGQDNGLAVDIGSDGIQPLTLTGNATFNTGSYIAPVLSDPAKLGQTFALISASGRIATNNVSLVLPARNSLTWKLHLSEDEKVLSLSVYPPGTLFIVR